jgi:transposase-like protein
MNIIEISNKFPDELSAVKYFERLRFGKVLRCAYCDSTKLSKREKDMRFKCYECKKSSSVTVNTFLHDTRLPLKTWLFAFSIVTDAKKGLSALQLQRNLSVSYPTAFKMYHKMRELMAIDNKEEQETEELQGVVEMDETFIGGKPRKFNKCDTKSPRLKKLDRQIDQMEDEGFNFKPKRKNRAKCDPNPKRGRGTSNIPVVGIVERDGNVVAEVMRKLTFENLKKMVEKYVDEDDSVLITDDYSGYNRMRQIIAHIKIDHHKMYSYRGVNSNSIESFWAIIERGIIGQYHSVSLKKLPNYIAEFVFKYNNRKEDDMFITLVKNAVKTAA